MWPCVKQKKKKKTRAFDFKSNEIKFDSTYSRAHVISELNYSYTKSHTHTHLRSFAYNMFQQQKLLTNQREIPE